MFATFPIEIARRHATWLALAGCATIAGCQQKAPTTAVVKGRVTYANQPVTGGTICFRSERQGPVAQVKGMITNKGEFSLGGVPIGNVRVTIETSSVKEKIARKEAPPGYLVHCAIPRKYADPNTSDLVLDVVAGEQTRDVELR